MVQLYLIAGSIVTLGFVWFWIVRPIAVSARDAIADWRTPRAPRRQRTTRRSARRAAPPRRARPTLPVHLMFRSNGGSAPINIIKAEQRSYAVERPVEPRGTGIGNAFPALSEQVGTLSDDELLRELALVVNEDGAFKYAESRIAKFIGGRTEDRITQVRAVRGVAAPPKPVATKDYPHRTVEQDILRRRLGIK